MELSPPLPPQKTPQNPQGLGSGVARLLGTQGQNALMVPPPPPPPPLSPPRGPRPFTPCIWPNPNTGVYVSWMGVAVIEGDIATHFHLDTQMSLPTGFCNEAVVDITITKVQAKAPLNGHLILGRVKMETNTL